MEYDTAVTIENPPLSAKSPMLDLINSPLIRVIWQLCSCCDYLKFIGTGTPKTCFAMRIQLTQDIICQDHRIHAQSRLKNLSLSDA